MGLRKYGVVHIYQFTGFPGMTQPFIEINQGISAVF